MTANKWYCIAQTTTFDTGCGISVIFEGSSILFTASVRYGSASLNISDCYIQEDYLLSVRLRETESKWCVDLLSNKDINPSIDIADSPYWEAVNTVAGAGNILAVINDIDKQFNTQKGGGGDSLWEKINIGSEEAPVWAVRPKPILNDNTQEEGSEEETDPDATPVGVVSDTFVTAGGVNGNSNAGLYDRLDEWPSEFTEEYFGWVPSAKLVYELKLLIGSGSGSGGGSTGGIDAEQLKNYLDLWGYITKDRADGLYAPKESTEKRLASLEAMFGWYPSDEDRQSIKAKAGLWGDSFLTAGGINAAATNGPAYDRLDEWPEEFTEDYNGYVLSAKLAYEMKNLIGSGGSSGGTGGSIDLSDYVTKGEISYYAKLTDLEDYAKTTDLSDYAKASELDKYLPIAGGTITGNLRLKGSGNFGNYLYFGDGSYAYFAELSDDNLTIKATNINLSGNVYINGEAYQAGSDVDLTGYATQTWVTDNFVKTGASVDYAYSASQFFIQTNTSTNALPILISNITSTGYGKALMCSTSTNATIVPSTGAFYAKSVTHGSDMRYKSVLNDIAEDIEVIANAPLFDYTWNNQEDKTPLVGTSAQYWLDTKFRNAVSYNKVTDFYSLGYGELGVAIGILNARKIVSHEERIKVLEAENAALKTALKGLRRRIG